MVLLLIAALPTQLEAALALDGVRPDVDRLDGGLHRAFAWLLTRPIVEPVYRTVLIPGLGMFGVMFGLWYAGLGLSRKRSAWPSARAMAFIPPSGTPAAPA